MRLVDGTQGDVMGDCQDRRRSLAIGGSILEPKTDRHYGRMVKCELKSNRSGLTRSYGHGAIVQHSG